MENNIIYSVDTETTGLHPDTDEILQLSIVDENGGVIFNEYFCPSFHLAWDEAEKINHITPEMVVGKPTIKERLAEINSIFARCNTIIGYKTGFDLSFLKAAGVEITNSVKVIDVQQMYMGIVASSGEWDWEHNCPKWRSLKECAESCRYEWQGEAHDSLADARATMECYIRLYRRLNGMVNLIHGSPSYLEPLKHCPFCRAALKESAFTLFCPLCQVPFKLKNGYWECGFKIEKILTLIPGFPGQFRVPLKQRNIEEGIIEIRKKMGSILSDCDMLVALEENDEYEARDRMQIWARTIKFKFKPREEFEQQDG